MERPDLSELAVGCNVIFVDPVAGQHQAVVTSIFGDPAVNVPCINIVYVNPDETMQDSYGRQIMRQTSLCHRSVNPAYGMYYMMPGDTPNPIKPAYQT